MSTNDKLQAILDNAVRASIPAVVNDKDVRRRLRLYGAGSGAPLPRLSKSQGGSVQTLQTRSLGPEWRPAGTCRTAPAKTFNQRTDWSPPLRGAAPRPGGEPLSAPRLWPENSMYVSGFRDSAPSSAWYRGQTTVYEAHVDIPARLKRVASLAHVESVAGKPSVLMPVKKSKPPIRVRYGDSVVVLSTQPRIRQQKNDLKWRELHRLSEYLDRSDLRTGTVTRVQFVTALQGFRRANLLYSLFDDGNNGVRMVKVIACLSIFKFDDAKTALIHLWKLFEGQSVSSRLYDVFATCVMSASDRDDITTAMPSIVRALARVVIARGTTGAGLFDDVTEADFAAMLDDDFVLGVFAHQFDRVRAITQRPLLSTKGVRRH